MEAAKPTTVLQKTAAAMRMIKIAHTVFAMPFAALGWAFAVVLVNEAGNVEPSLKGLLSRSLPPLAKQLGFEAAPWAWTLVWVVVAMVGARSFAMAFNRIVDRKFDAANPRTAKREIPAGVLSLRFAWAFTLASAALFLLACWMLNAYALCLAPVALLVIGGYSLTKRFTSLCHVVLGLGLALAPMGAWVAVMGSVVQYGLGQPPVPFGIEVFGRAGASAQAYQTYPLLLAGMPVAVAPLLGLGVLLWVSGFDIIYSLQDEQFDRSRGLRSIPVRLGAKRALGVSRILHVLAIASWAFGLWLMMQSSSAQSLAAWQAGYAYEAYAPSYSLGPLSVLALALATLCLLYEHSLVKHDDLSRVNAAFFTVNGVISVAFAALVLLDLFVV